MILTLLLPLLKTLEIDPASLANRLGRDQFTRRMERGIPAAVRNLQAHGLTPAKTHRDAVAQRQMVRSGLYLLFKRGLAMKVGGNVLADGLRDHYDDACVSRVLPQLTATQTTEEALGIIVREVVEQIF